MDLNSARRKTNLSLRWAHVFTKSHRNPLQGDFSLKSTQGQRASRLTARLISNATLYGAGSALVKLGALAILPLYWALLTPDDFGLIALSQVITQFLASILDLGFSGAIQRHYHEWDEKERPHYLAAIFTFSTLMSFSVCLALSLLTPQIISLLGDKYNSTLVQFGIWTAFLQNLGLLPFSIYRSREQLIHFTKLTLWQFAVQSAGILSLIYFFNWGHVGFLTGTLIGALVYSLIGLKITWQEIKYPFTKEHLRGPLRYALPTIPAALLEAMGNTIDRIFLQNLISLRDLGIYSVGRQFGMAYNFVVANLKGSWVPLVYRMTAERDDTAKVLSQMSIYYFFILSAFGYLAAVFSADVMVLFNQPEYYQVAGYAPFFILSYYLSGIGNIFGRGLDLAKKTQYYWIVYAVNLFSNVCFLYFWAPKYGAWGAIAALTVSGILREATLIALANWAYPRPLKIAKILQTFLFFSVAYGLTFLIKSENVFLVLALKSVFSLFVMTLGFILIFGISGTRSLIEMIKKKVSALKNRRQNKG